MKCCRLFVILGVSLLLAGCMNKYDNGDTITTENILTGTASDNETLSGGALSGGVYTNIHLNMNIDISPYTIFHRDTLSDFLSEKIPPKRFGTGAFVRQDGFGITSTGGNKWLGSIMINTVYNSQNGCEMLPISDQYKQVDSKNIKIGNKNILVGDYRGLQVETSYKAFKVMCYKADNGLLGEVWFISDSANINKIYDLVIVSFD